jgi:hypothetical protein
LTDDRHQPVSSFLDSNSLSIEPETRSTEPTDPLSSLLFFFLWIESDLNSEWVSDVRTIDF